jgi:hypothetical protein
MLMYADLHFSTVIKQVLGGRSTLFTNGKTGAWLLTFVSSFHVTVHPVTNYHTKLIMIIQTSTKISLTMTVTTGLTIRYANPKIR